MKKFLAGILFGSILVFSITGYADSLIGKVVNGTYPLFIDGDQANQYVIVVEGTSYFPVREAGTVFGYDVSFKEKQVFLDRQSLQTMDGEDVTEEPLVETYVPKEVDLPEHYYYRSDVIDIWHIYDDPNRSNKEELLPYWVRDGATYVPIQIFNHYRVLEDGTATFALPNGIEKSYTVTGQEKYEIGVKVFNHRSKTLINVSEFGYAVEIRDGMAWIEAQ